MTAQNSEAHTGKRYELLNGQNGGGRPNSAALCRGGIHFELADCDTDVRSEAVHCAAWDNGKFHPLTMHWKHTHSCLHSEQLLFVETEERRILYGGRALLSPYAYLFVRYIHAHSSNASPDGSLSKQAP